MLPAYDLPMNVPRTHVWLRALAILCMIPTSCFAYGGWRAHTPYGCVLEVTSRLLSALPWIVLPYLFCSYLMERMPVYRWIPVLGFFLYLGALAPKLAVGGEYGAAHVAMGAMGRLICAFAILLLLKWAWLSNGGKNATSPASKQSKRQFLKLHLSTLMIMALVAGALLYWLAPNARLFMRSSNADPNAIAYIVLHYAILVGSVEFIVAAVCDWGQRKKAVHNVAAVEQTPARG